MDHPVGSETSVAVYELDAVRIDVRAHLIRDGFDHPNGARPQPTDREGRVQVEAEPLVHLAVPEPGQVQRGFAEGLRRDPGVDRGRAAGARAALDDRNTLAEVRGLRRSLLACGSCADDDHVEALDHDQAVCTTDEPADHLRQARCRS